MKYADGGSDFCVKGCCCPYFLDVVIWFYFINLDLILMFMVYIDCSKEFNIWCLFMFFFSLNMEHIFILFTRVLLLTFCAHRGDMIPT